MSSNGRKSQGRLGDLINGARYANPDNPELFLFAEKLGINSTDQKKSTLEAFVGANHTFLDVAVWRAQLSRLEWCMCRDRRRRGRRRNRLSDRTRMWC